ncbi:MAG TPA: 5'/3'-nucleotidase SurE [Steroidobacteraceae bacterium]|nr:5'/3'-nucleotidase SurE [Steroidobacteraceae bacterium]
MKILVSNDDGFRAEGIRRLREALATLAEVTVVAPDRNKSGASNSLTLDVPLRVFESEPGVYFVPGTPTDCVHLAISGLFDFEHDMVVSGVNDGANLGDDVLYSGTVAAAVEGRFLGLPTIAVSLCTGTGGAGHFETGAEVARLLVAQLLKSPLQSALILNVNVPDVPFAQLRGFRAGHARARPARPSGVLDRFRRGGARRGSRYRFRHRCPGIRIGDSLAGRPHPSRGTVRSRHLAGRHQ